MLNYVYISVIFINIHIKHEDKYTNIVNSTIQLWTIQPISLQ